MDGWMDGVCVHACVRVRVCVCVCVCVYMWVGEDEKTRASGRNVGKVFNPVVKLVLENQPFLMPEPAEKPSLRVTKLCQVTSPSDCHIHGLGISFLQHKESPCTCCPITRRATYVSELYHLGGTLCQSLFYSSVCSVLILLWLGAGILKLRAQVPSFSDYR